MSKRGDAFINPITSEYGAIRLGTEDTPDKRVVSDLKVRPSRAGIGDHVHPSIEERVTVVSGKIRYRLNGKEGVVTGGDVLEFERNMVHDWWNSGDNEARVIVEIIPAVRFELMVSTLFGLVKDGKTNKKGAPNLLQMAVIVQEFADVVKFISPLSVVRNGLFSIMASLGRMMGYQAIYDQYVNWNVEQVELDPLPEHLQYLDNI